MRGAILGFVIGVAILQTRAALPNPAVQFALILVGFSLAALAWKNERFAARWLVLPLAGALLGFAWAALIARHYLAQELPPEWEGRDITVVGVVDSLPYEFEQGVHFNLAVEQVIADGGQTANIPRRLALSWYFAFGHHGSGSGADAKVAPGERWRLTVRLRRPHGNANPYGFDYEAWLLEQNLRATGYVRADQNSRGKNRRLDDFVLSFGNLVERARGWLRERIHDALPDKKYAGVIVALVIGDQRGIGHGE